MSSARSLNIYYKREDEDLIKKFDEIVKKKSVSAVDMNRSRVVMELIRHYVNSDGMVLAGIRESEFV